MIAPTMMLRMRKYSVGVQIPKKLGVTSIFIKRVITLKNLRYKQ